MKKLNFIDKLVFFFNSVAAAMLLLSYLLPYVAPKNFSLLSVLSLGVPLLIVLNVLFFIYWLLKVKKQLLLSLIVLALGYNYLGSLYKFSSSKDVNDTNNITIMNYNVRLFNLYNWISEDAIETKIINLIKEQKPDILSIQEYHPHKNVDMSFYPHKYEVLSGNKTKHGQAIFSKYPIVNSGSIKFPHTANNAIFADVVIKKDTIRVYNVHLESLRITKDLEELNTEDSERIIKSVGKTFEMQQFQTELFLLHKRQCKHAMIITGDFNNTPYSYVYKEIKGDLKDTFTEAGNGFGKTFNFKYFPVRIDYILVSKDITINGFKTLDEKLSDHFPIVAKIKLH
jgi:endonuclease/exonuclease/phosphatase family metal-dependent hydrolase